MFDVVNWLLFDIKNYIDDCIDEDMARILMWEDILDQMKSLLKNHYIAVLKDLDKDLVVIEFNPDNNHFEGNDIVNPYWMPKSEYSNWVAAALEKEDFYRKLP